jgi:hypothetical protein
MRPQPRSTEIIPCPNRTGVLPARIRAVTLAAVRSRRHCASWAPQQHRGVTGGLRSRWVDQLPAPSPLANRSHHLTHPARCARPGGPTGWTRGYATAAKLGAAVRGYFGCLRSFPEVRKTVSYVSCTYLEVHAHLLFVRT